MTTHQLLADLDASKEKSRSSAMVRDVLDRLVHCLRTLDSQRSDPSCPERTAAKIQLFLAHVEASARDLGSKMHHPAYSLNVMGEAMVRSGLIHGAVVEFLQVGLYFYGLDQIERRWPSQAIVYSGVHCDSLGEFLSRSSLKELLAAGQSRLEAGRHFCLTYIYLNQLRRAYWKHCRASEDALDVAIRGTLVEAEAEHADGGGRAEAGWDPGDRVQLLLGVFRDQLSDEQRFIYLAKTRARLRDAAPGAVPSTIEELLGDLAGDDSGGMSWSEIARRLQINEKTAKREYLKTLHTLLKATAEAVLGAEGLSRGYVRRVLALIREIIAEKDLRIRSNNGRGLRTLVEKWEVALRFVLNHERAEVA